MKHEASPAHVLVVDDDWAVRQAIRKALEREGYRVSEASGVSEAWRHWEGTSRPFDLAVLDVALAGEESGIALAEEMEWRGAARGFLFISGYVEVARTELPVPAERTAFVGKPLSISRFLEEVRSLLREER